MRAVVDASVALKWFFRGRENEADQSAALDLLRQVADGKLTLIQPPHFVAEVSAVLARELVPSAAAAALRSLLEIEMQLLETDAVYMRAMALSAQLGQHLFDTLYHAVALENGPAQRVTADERYYRKAHKSGGIVRLADFSAAPSA